VSTTFDERTAWDLVRAVPPGLGGQSSHYLYHESSPDVGLQVWSTGRWRLASAAPDAAAPPMATDAARDVLDVFLPLQVRSTLVIGQLGQSLDGRIATASGQSHYVTGAADIRRLHRLRALVDAVVVGAGTVASDDPRLSVREVEGSDPVRVVLDPRRRLAPAHHVFSDGRARTIVIHGASADPRDANVHDVVMLPTTASGTFDPRLVVRTLRGLGYARLLVEGGGITVSRFLQADVLDRLHITVAPLLIGSGRAAITLLPIESLEHAIRPACRHFRLGEDVLFDLDLRSPAPSPSA